MDEDFKIGDFVILDKSVYDNYKVNLTVNKIYKIKDIQIDTEGYDMIFVENYYYYSYRFKKDPIQLRKLKLNKLNETNK